MSDLSDWIQSYWYELLSLTVQFAILTVAVWFGRRALTLLAPSHRQLAPAARPSEVASAFITPDRDEPKVRAAEYSRADSILSETPALSTAPNLVPARPATKQTNPLRAGVNWLRAPMYQRTVKRTAAPAASLQTESVPAEPEPQPAGHAGVGRMLSVPHQRESYMATHADEEPLASATYGRERHAAGHAGVGRMLSPLPDQPSEQEKVVSYRLVKRTNPWQAIVNWLRSPINNHATTSWQRVTIRQ